MNRKIRNEIYKWIQLLVFGTYVYETYKGDTLQCINLLLFMLVIEFVCKDKEE